MNYYNEFDPFAAAWLRNLIAAGLIPDGDVDTRSITEIKADELKGYTQCHFFAGIGGWSYALQLAGWPADRPVWTGSCPCQPFSSAGKQKGKEDERHLWPVWFELIRQSRPPVVFGEQVSSAIRHHWWDDVADDLEGEGYTTRAEIRPASSSGAPHKRDRLWFVADTKGERGGRASRSGCETIGRSTTGDSLQLRGANEKCSPLGNAEHDGSPCGQIVGSNGEAVSNHAQGADCAVQFEGTGQSGDVANVFSAGSQGYGGLEQEPSEEGRQGTQRYPWASGVWIDCPDGKQRLIEPSIPLLAHGIPNRVGRLRGYGNAIVPQVAAHFIVEKYNKFIGL